ncbi:unnamed protein product [Ixodes pacificus]
MYISQLKSCRLSVFAIRTSINKATMAVSKMVLLLAAVLVVAICITSTEGQPRPPGRNPGRNFKRGGAGGRATKAPSPYKYGDLGVVAGSL